MADKVYKIVYVEQDLESVTLLKRIVRTESVKSDFIIDVTSVNTLTQIVESIETNNCDLILLRHSPHLPSLSEVAAEISMKEVSIISVVSQENIAAAQSLYVEGAVAVTAFANEKAAYKQIINVLFTRSLKVGYRSALEKNRELLERSSELLSTTSNMIAYVNDGLFLYANKAFLEYFGFENFEELQKNLLLDLVNVKDANKFKKILKTVTTSGKEVTTAITFKHNATGAELATEFIYKKSTYEGETCLELFLEQKATVVTEAVAAPVAAPIEDKSFNNRSAFFKILPNFIDTSSWLLCIVIEDYVPLRKKHGALFVEVYVKNVVDQLKNQMKDLHITRFTDHSLLMLIPNMDMSNIDRIGLAIATTASSYSYSIGENELVSQYRFVYTGLGNDLKQISNVLKSLDRQGLLLMDDAEKIAAQALNNDDENADKTLSPEEASQSNLRVEEEIRNDEFMPLQKGLSEKSVLFNYLPVADFTLEGGELYFANYDLVHENGEVFYWNKGFTHNASNSIVMRLDNLLIEQALHTIDAAPAKDKTVFVPLSLSYLMDPTVLVKYLSSKGIDKVFRERIICGFAEEAVGENFERAAKFFTAMKKNGLSTFVYGVADIIDTQLGELDVSYIALSENFVGRLSRGRDSEEHEHFTAFLETLKKKNIKVLAEGVNSPPHMAMVWEYAIPLASGSMVGTARKQLDFDFSQIMM